MSTITEKCLSSSLKGLGIEHNKVAPYHPPFTIVFIFIFCQIHLFQFKPTGGYGGEECASSIGGGLGGMLVASR